MKSLLFECDFEEFNLPLDFGEEISERLMIEKTDEGMRRLLELIKRHEIKTTFFVTEKIAEIYPDLLRRLTAEGHEIGLHPSINYKKDINPNEIINPLRHIKEKIEHKLKTKIYGFKNHKLILLPAYIIREAGFVYDNTCHPTYVPGRYFYFFKSRKVTIQDGIINIPISVTPIFRLPFSWIWFRNLGLNYVKFCASQVLLKQEYINMYIHAWDLVDINDISGLRLPYLVKNNTGQKMEQLLDRFFRWCKIKGVNTETIYNYLMNKNYILSGSKDS